MASSVVGVDNKPVESEKASVVTGDEMSDALRRIGWSVNELSRRLRIGERRLRRMTDGREEIPENLADWLRGLAENMDRQPRMPKDWRMRGED